MIQVELVDRQTIIEIDAERIQRVARSILQRHGPQRTQLSIAVVDDPTIHELNRRYLEHDYPTDVLSFVLESDEQFLDGEVIVSAETAQREAPAYRNTPQDELLLYVIHGVLHLVGFDDQTLEQRRRMEEEQRRVLAEVERDAG